MVNVNQPAAVSVGEDQGVLTIRYKGGSFPGFAVIGLAAAFIVPIGYRLLTSPLREGDLSFAFVFGPLLAFVVFLGIRMVLNTTTLTADGSQIIVKVRPLPFLPAKRVSVADLRSLEVERKTQTGKGGTRVHYYLVARLRDESTTRLMHFQGLEFKESTNILKERLEKKFRL